MISVVIPTRNRPILLFRAVESVLKQSVLPDEVLIIDDHSDVQTNSIISLNPRIIQYFYKEKQGGSNAARNDGIRASNGDIIFFLDDDDLWKENHIDLCMKVFNKKQEIALVYSGKEVFIESNTERIKYIIKAQEKSIHVNRDVRNAARIGSTSAVAIRREVLIHIGMFDESLAANQDYDLFVRICRAYRISATCAISVKYQDSTINNITNNYNKKVSAFLYLKKKYHPENSHYSYREYNYIMAALHYSLFKLNANAHPVRSLYFLIRSIFGDTYFAQNILKKTIRRVLSP